jgi:hypothetical protein
MSDDYECWDGMGGGCCDSCGACVCMGEDHAEDCQA